MANANFTPDIGPYTELKPFRFWCQKVLPLVYDDSLSYYELLGKVVNYLNKTMEDVDTQITDIQGLLSAYEALQDWVNHYYDSADFAADIDDGLDRMAESGQLTALINAIIAPQLPDIVDLLLPETVMTLLPDEVSSQIPGTVATQLPSVVSNQIPGTVANQLPGVVSNQIGGTVANQLPAVVSNQIGPVVEDKIVDPVEDWLDANVSGGIAVDRTLSVLGAGADAAFTGARLETLDNVAGYEHIADTGFIITTANPYAFNYTIINNNDVFSDQGTHTYKMIVVPVNTGDKYSINAHKISVTETENHFAVTYAFCAKWIGDPETDIPYYLPTTYSRNNAENLIVTVPEINIPAGQAYDTTGYLVVITANIEDPVYKVVNEGLLKDVNDLKSDLKSATGAYTFFKDKSINYTAPTTINDEANWECILVECEEGDTFYLRGKGGSSTRLWFFSDVNGSVLEPKANSGAYVYSFKKIIAPQGAKYLSVNSNYTVIKGELFNDNSILQKQIDSLSSTMGSMWLAENETNILFSGLLENKGTSATTWFIDPIPADQYPNNLYCMVSELKGDDGTEPYIAYIHVAYSDSTSNTTYIYETNKAVKVLIDQTKTVSQISFVGYRSNGTVESSVLTTWDALFYSGNKIADVDAIATNANSYATKSYSSAKQIESIVLGNVDTSDLFEVGNISISTDGWTYDNSNSRVRTKEGKTVFLESGDVIGLKDYTNYRQYIGYRILINGSYSSSGRWLQEDYIVNATGEYVWNVTSVPEARVTDIQTYVDQIVIKRMRNLKNDSVKSNMNVACHRGYASIAPENTIPAFKLAKQMGYNTVETDVAFTSDSVPVLLHDSTINRTSDGTGNIEDLTYDYIRTLDFGSWKSSVYAGTKIPSFEEFCVFCRSAGLKAYAELKATVNTTKAQMKQLVDIAIECGMIDNISWVSFSKQALLWVAEYLPNARYGLLASSISSTTVSDANDIKAVANNVFVSADLNNIDATAVGLMIAAEIPLEEYTANRYDHIINANPYITGFTTDNAHPDIILLHSAGVIE